MYLQYCKKSVEKFSKEQRVAQTIHSVIVLKHVTKSWLINTKSKPNVLSEKSGFLKIVPISRRKLFTDYIVYLYIHCGD